ncbi:MAG: undecaprenyl-diphosphate phosphatase [Rhodothermales bacterium]|nr:undecaprenyl-diphosphate phosphatase [Rhodothermales bacterium]
MHWWEAVLLGLIQGLTEFLPVSSSGHLVLAQHLLGLSPKGSHNVTFDVFVHFGTAMSILTVYRHRILEILTETLRALGKPAQLPRQYHTNETFRTACFILLTMIPTGITYILFKDFLEARFSDPRFTCAMLLVTGTLLLLTQLRKNPSGPITPIKALLIGVAQSVAMLPGISRSGSTICAALYQNVTPQRAADFSFLMLLPVVIGATLIKGMEVLQTGIEISWTNFGIGAIVAYASGILAIKVAIEFVRRGNLRYFAYYCFVVGALGLWLIT